MNKYIAEELRDQKIGFLTVGDRVRDVKNHPLYDGTHSSYFRQGVIRECLCDCGKTILLSEAIIMTERVKSCGCWRQQKLQRSWEKKQRLLDLNKKIKDYRSHIGYLGTKLELMRFHPLSGSQDKDGMMILAKEIIQYKKLLSEAKKSFTALKKKQILIDK